MKKRSLTIVGVTGHSRYTTGTMYAIWQSYLALKAKIPTLKCLLISPDKPENLPDFIEHQATNPFSYLEYNLFMLYSLDQFIDTDYALIVQEDGWVWNGNEWDERFFDYDYIGAIVPVFIHHSDPRLSMDSIAWFQHQGKAPEGMFVPQNGGFCLRSKAMLSAPKRLGLPYDLSHLVAERQRPFSFTFMDNRHIEDIYLSGIYRRVLEQSGLKFAPTEISLRFSVESMAVLVLYNQLHCHNGINYMQVVGQHTRGDIKIIGLNQVKLNTPFTFSEQQFLNDPTVQKLTALGYDISIPKHLLEGELQVLA